VEIVRAESQQHLEHIRALLCEYFRWVTEDHGIDLGYQNVEAELASLPGCYAPPMGRLLLVLDGEKAAGCIAIRPMEKGVCELKRMYVRPEYRGQGLGKTLAQTVLQEARSIGYKLVRLDTADTMLPAQQLYASLGFRRARPYYDAPPDIAQRAVFMELRLGQDLIGQSSLACESGFESAG
jgi:putative acetyltransferase